MTINKSYDIQRARREITRIIKIPSQEAVLSQVGTILHDLKRYHGCEAPNALIKEMDLTRFGIKECSCLNCIDQSKK